MSHDSKYDELNSDVSVKSHAKLSLLQTEEESKEQCFQINWKHVDVPIAAPLAVKQVEARSFADIIRVAKKTTIPKEVADVWGGYGFSDSYLDCYLPYLESNQSSLEVKNMVSCIAHELVNSQKQYDVPSILAALSAHGGVCNVQKEIGIRMVYAGMMDSMMEHMKANSLETRVLNILKRARVALSEEVAIEICKSLGYFNGFINSHYLVPLQNKMSKEIGIDFVPEPNPCSVNSSGEVEKFKEKYTAHRVIGMILSAVNDHKTIKYQECLEYLESIRPEGVDAYAYLNDFVFDMDTGKFTERAIKFLLWTMGVIELSPHGVKSLKAAEKSIEVNKGKIGRGRVSSSSNRKKSDGVKSRKSLATIGNNKVSGVEVGEPQSAVMPPTAFFVGVWLLAFAILYVAQG
eukprot:TRINITY_DN4545_c0_g1_i6.p1 TRINITY_DN4545_c0_g1~~TRINITY_DN4545_c0_g1_i6.p1  ORF type:complete len:428 (-),score=98.63 TRINITY_DN4545_c0_g1_i6:168-1382(-)